MTSKKRLAILATGVTIALSLLIIFLILPMFYAITESYGGCERYFYVVYKDVTKHDESKITKAIQSVLPKVHYMNFGGLFKNEIGFSVGTKVVSKDDVSVIITTLENMDNISKVYGGGEVCP